MLKIILVILQHYIYVQKVFWKANFFNTLWGELKIWNCFIIILKRRKKYQRSYSTVCSSKNG